MRLIVQENNGDEDQNKIINPINSYEGEETMGNKIEKLLKEIEIYKKAIQDAEDALASAEKELDETLEMEYDQ